MKSFSLKLGAPVLVAVLLLCGFFSPLRQNAQLPNDALPVPIVRQSTEYSCGAASLLGILQYWKKTDEGETALFGPLGTDPKDGTAPDSLVRVAKSYGLSVRLQEPTTLSDLRAGLSQGETIILDIQAWRTEGDKTPWVDNWEDGHYVVLVGMDASFGYFMDPVVGTSYTYLPLPELEERWHDYENRSGTVNRHHELAIFIKGSTPHATFPSALQLTE